MTDPTPEAPPVVPPFVPGDWKTSVAAKQIAWMLAAWKAAVAAGVTMAPVLSTAIDKLSDQLEPYGLTISIDQPVFAKFIPVLLFAAMIVAHDYAKWKTQSKWL
jgi:hypothetical protein